MIYIFKKTINLDENFLQDFILEPFDEIRLKKLKDPLRKRQFLTARKIVAYIKKKYSLSFYIKKNGKPDFKFSKFTLSITHSNNIVLVGFAKLKYLGLDIEKQKDLALCFAKKILTKNEQILFKEKKLQLINSWTQKESYVKATGAGIKTGFANLEFLNNQKQPKKITTINKKTKKYNYWQSESLDISKDYVSYLTYVTYASKKKLPIKLINFS